MHPPETGELQETRVISIPLEEYEVLIIKENMLNTLRNAYQKGRGLEALDVIFAVGQLAEVGGEIF